ncbi:MAG: hypothetical protein R2778_02780 [Saprospiraceae bacterium]
MNTALIFNVIGDRISQVGTVGYGDIYEAPPALDFRFQNIGERGEIKFTWGDILNQDFLYYQDENSAISTSPEWIM